jgi:small conductance mechanosensitive channel
MNEHKLLNVFELFWNKLIQWLPEVFTSLIVLLIGIWVIRFIAKRLKKTPIYKSFEPSIAHFSVIVIKIILYVILFLSIASLLGIPMTSFIAIIGSIGIAIGLAMQSHLSNIAAGIEILILKPIKDGDFVQIDNYTGTVKKVRLYFTELTTVDNRQVVIPNNIIMSKSLENFTKEEFRKLDLVVGISYDSNIRDARNLILNLLEKDIRVLKEPDLPLVAVGELAESSVNLVVRCWTKTDDLQNLKWDFLENLKNEFDNAGIKIPFPQREVHQRQIIESVND